MNYQILSFILSHPRTLDLVFSPASMQYRPLRKIPWVVIVFLFQPAGLENSKTSARSFVLNYNKSINQNSRIEKNCGHTKEYNERRKVDIET